MPPFFRSVLDIASPFRYNGENSAWETGMKIYDITQELFSCHVYPGDIAPSFRRVSDVEKGDVCSITEFSMNAHNGTHLDAPRHFVKGGKTIEELDLQTLIGPCTVARFDGGIDAAALTPYRGTERLLAKGDCFLTLEGAEALSEIGVKLFGLEAQSVTGSNPPMAVHVETLSKGIVLLEGVTLDGVEEGEYTLFAAPLKLGGSEGAPCRAVLIRDEGKDGR